MFYIEFMRNFKMHFKVLILPLFIILFSCTSDENNQNEFGDDSGQVYLTKIEQIRHSEQPYVYILGGIYDGAAWNQETRLIVTNNDILTCVFTDATSRDNTNFLTFYHWESEKISGLYEKITSIIKTPTNRGFAAKQSDNFIYERNFTGGSRFWTNIGWEAGNFDVLDSFLRENPHPCWAWG